MGAAATLGGGGGVQYCPFRASTAHAAGGVIRDCLDAARHCLSTALTLTQRSHLAATRTDCYARRCRCAALALTQRSHLAATRTDLYAAPRCRSAPPAHSALTPRRHRDRLLCRPPLPVRRPRTHAALPPGRHHRCDRHHCRPRTHLALTPRCRPNRLLCRPLLLVRRLRTRPALSHRLPHVRR